MLISAPSAVSVVQDGRLIVGSTSAFVAQGGSVIAPVDPYVCAFADRIDINPERGIVRFARGSRSITLNILPIGPYVRDEPLLIPLGAVARALGMDVRYDARNALVSITSSPPEPLATPTPYAAQSAPPHPTTIFPPPEEAPQPPAATPNAFPLPRRTPIALFRRP